MKTDLHIFLEILGIFEIDSCVNNIHLGYDSFL